MSQNPRSCRSPYLGRKTGKKEGRKKQMKERGEKSPILVELQEPHNPYLGGGYGGRYGEREIWEGVLHENGTSVILEYTRFKNQQQHQHNNRYTHSLDSAVLFFPSHKRSNVRPITERAKGKNRQRAEAAVFMRRRAK
jgi:hypothetical protein